MTTKKFAEFNFIRKEIKSRNKRVKGGDFRDHLIWFQSLKEYGGQVTGGL